PAIIAATPGVPVAQQQAVAAAAAARGPAGGGATAAAVPAAVPAAARLRADAAKPDQKGVSARYFATQFWKGSDPRVIGGEVTVIGEPDVTTTVANVTQEWGEGSPDAKIPNDH